jgi:hypothetical protein
MLSLLPPDQKNLPLKSALFLGVNGFSVLLPQIPAGIISVPVLYHLVKRCFGSAAASASPSARSIRQPSSSAAGS